MTLHDDAGTKTDFGGFARRLRLRHFSPAELLTKTERPGNTLPPRSLWPNLVPTALVLDRLRAEIGAPVVILSGYRSPAYNRAVGGSTYSQHVAFTALDVASSGAEPEELHDLLTRWRGRWFDCPVALDGRQPAETTASRTPFRPLEVEPRGAGCRFLWAGGIGLYDTFVHLDSRGIDTDWDQRSQGNS